jgi:hypothetical protein
MKYLSLTLPGGQTVQPPSSIPHGGLSVVAKVVGNAITLLLIITTVLSLIYLILGGIQWINSGGDKSKVSSARGQITFAIVGLVIALVSFFIINLVGYFFKTNLLQIG